MRLQELVADRFEVSECVGTGSCGAVYRAWDLVLEREVAIKALDCAIDERVMRASKAAARLHHPAIVPLYEVGETDGAAFLVSEYIDGLTLRQAHGRGALTDRDVAEIGADLCEGLHHAHGRGVVHGDLKPENVIVRSREENPDSRSGRCQAKLRDFATREILAGREGLGDYMTPEQLEGVEPGPPSDVFGVALVLFECWTGRNPLGGASSARIAQVRGRHIPSLRELRPDLPEGLASVIDAALDADPGRRPALLDLREWLDHVFDDLDDLASVPEPVAPEPDPPRRGRALAATLATLAAAAAAALAGAAPVAFALACWPRDARRRFALGAAATLAVLTAALLAGPGTAPITLGDGDGLAALLTPYVLLLALLWGAAASLLGVLARAPSPVSGAALATALCLLALITTELLSRAADAQSIGSLAPLALVAAIAVAAAVAISRRAARSASALAIAGSAERDGAGASLVPPEPPGAEPIVTRRAEAASERFQLARVP